jgi:hypothetical protein
VVPVLTLVLTLVSILASILAILAFNLTNAMMIAVMRQRKPTFWEILKIQLT